MLDAPEAIAVLTFREFVGPFVLLPGLLDGIWMSSRSRAAKPPGPRRAQGEEPNVHVRSKLVRF
jgi:hypothetical protein